MLNLLDLQAVQVVWGRSTCWIGPWVPGTGLRTQIWTLVPPTWACILRLGSSDPELPLPGSLCRDRGPGTLCQLQQALQVEIRAPGDCAASLVPHLRIRRWGLALPLPCLVWGSGSGAHAAFARLFALGSGFGSHMPGLSLECQI